MTVVGNQKGQTKLKKTQAEHTNLIQCARWELNPRRRATRQQRYTTGH